MSQRPEYVTHVTAVTVMPKGAAIFDETATVVRIDDLAGGPFVVLTQSASVEARINISPDEWPVLRRAIDKMIAECKRIEP